MVPYSIEMESQRLFKVIEQNIEASTLGAEEKLRANEMVEDMLQNVVQNTVQHGSVRANNPQIFDVATQLKTHISRDDHFIFVRVVNPQVKPFPMALNKEFKAGDYPSIPIEQRSGFRGSGVGHYNIFKALEGLPAGSTVEWNANGVEIIFSLKIKIN